MRTCWEFGWSVKKRSKWRSTTIVFVKGAGVASNMRQKVSFKEQVSFEFLLLKLSFYYSPKYISKPVICFLFCYICQICRCQVARCLKEKERRMSFDSDGWGPKKKKPKPKQNKKLPATIAGHIWPDFLYQNLKKTTTTWWGAFYASWKKTGSLPWR